MTTGARGISRLPAFDLRQIPARQFATILTNRLSVTKDISLNSIGQVQPPLRSPPLFHSLPPGSARWDCSAGAGSESKSLDLILFVGMWPESPRAKR